MVRLLRFEHGGYSLMTRIDITQTYAAHAYLLIYQPKILVDRAEAKLNPQTLKLLIYMAESGKTEYDRDELIRIVYGSVTDQTRGIFRKKTLYLLRNQFSNVLPEGKSDDIVYFACAQVWVDSRVFAEQARALLDGGRGFDKETYSTAKAALSLYQAPFLNEYAPKSSKSVNNAYFKAWQRSRQRDLGLLYQQVLDRMIAFCLLEQPYWDEAKRYAETWRRGEDSSARPLQYLIWLAAREHDEALNVYLSELRTREEAGELPMGPTWSEWNSLLKSGRGIPISRLLWQPDSRVEMVTLPTATVDEQLDRQDELEQILTLFTLSRQEVVFAITGLAGIGKTSTAQAAAQLLLERNPRWKVLQLTLTSPFDVERLCNDLLIGLGRHDLLTLDYAQKRQRLIQLLQMPDLVVIVDEEYTTFFADLEKLNNVLTIMRGTHVMFVARELARFKHYVIELNGLDIELAKHFLVSHVSWLKQVEETQLTEIADLTEGLPLLLHMIVGGLKKELGRIHSLIDYLKTHDASASNRKKIYTVYENVMAWLWQYLESKDKDLLYAVSLFAPQSGAHSEALEVVLANRIPQGALLARLDRLVDMHLVERKDDASMGRRYILHAIIWDFVQRRVRHSRHPHAKMIEQAYIHYLLTFIREYHDQFDLLEVHKQSIFDMFELVLFGEDHVWAQPQAIEALKQAFPYIEHRGLYSTAARLIARALETTSIDGVETRIQLLRHGARISYFQADTDQSLKLHGEALDLAKHARVTHLYASLYHDVGNVYLQRGQFDHAVQNFEAAEQVVDFERQRRLLYSIWSNLGVCAFRQGDFEGAKAYYRRVLEHLESVDENARSELLPIKQFIQTALGTTYTELGDYEAALTYLNQSVDLARQLDYPQLVGYAYLNLGLTYAYRKEYEEADDCFARAGMIAEQINHAAMQAQVTLNQGILASKHFSHQEAFRLHRTALVQAEAHHLTWMKPQILLSLGKAYLRCNQFEAASQYFSEALALPDIAASYVSQMLYGLVLSMALQANSIVDDPMELTSDLIQSKLDELALSSLSLPLREIPNYLDWAQAMFQRDLDHILQLERYRIAEALQSWLVRVS